MNKIRIETDRVIGSMTKVLYIEDDADPVDISSIVTGINLDIRVGQINKATLDVLKVEVLGEGELVDAIVKTVRPPRWRKLRRLREITTLANHAKVWTRA